MAETDKPSSAESRAASDEALRAARLQFFKSRARFPFGVIFIMPILIMLLFAGSWYMRLHMLSAVTVAPDSTAVVIQLEQRVTNVEQQVQALGDRLNELGARVDQNSPVSVSTEISAPQSAPNPSAAATPPAASQATTRMQGDLAALSTALNALQAEIKQSKSDTAETRQTTHNALATAIAFIQLRETAAAGRGFEADLTALRAVAGNNGDFQEPLAQLEPYAAKGAPTIDALREEFADLESAASIAFDKATAQDWKQRLLADFKGLISIRPLHGGTASETFATTETALASGDLNSALDAAKGLPPEMQPVFKDWLTKAEARQSVDAALHTLTDRLTAGNAVPATPANAQGEP